MLLIKLERCTSPRLSFSKDDYSQKRKVGFLPSIFQEKRRVLVSTYCLCCIRVELNFGQSSRPAMNKQWIWVDDLKWNHLLTQNRHPEWHNRWDVDFIIFKNWPHRIPVLWPLRFSHRCRSDWRSCVQYTANDGCAMTDQPSQQWSSQTMCHLLQTFLFQQWQFNLSWWGGLTCNTPFGPSLRLSSVIFCADRSSLTCPLLEPRSHWPPWVLYSMKPCKARSTQSLRLHSLHR